VNHHDHILGLNDGGEDGWENYTAACDSCNKSKKDERVLSFLLRRLSRDGSR
jgi:5-methylcytosine-specific restriction endonuclease McrA